VPKTLDGYRLHLLTSHLLTYALTHLRTYSPTQPFHLHP
jgi:hypothetical protein